MKMRRKEKRRRERGRRDGRTPGGRTSRSPLVKKTLIHFSSGGGVLTSKNPERFKPKHEKDSAFERKGRRVVG